jgi:hypothetical protein
VMRKSRMPIAANSLSLRQARAHSFAHAPSQPRVYAVVSKVSV